MGPPRTDFYSPALLALLAGASALGSMAIHLLVPAFPLVGRDLAASSEEMQSALTIYLIALGVGQLIAGGSSDTWGRRPVLLLGVLLFVVGSAVAAISNSIELLVFGRVLQALGGAGALIAARTIVSDISHPDLVTGRLATLTTVVLISPAVSPVIGGSMAGTLGWRSIFVMLVALGLLILWTAFRCCAETRVGNAHQHGLLAAYARLLRNRRFRRYCMTNAAASSSLYIFLASSPFILSHEYGLSAFEAGLCYLAIAVSAISGTRLVRFAEHLGQGLRAGVGLGLVGGTLMLLYGLSNIHALAALIVPMLLIACGGGIAVPVSMSGAMHVEEGLAGTGSSLAGAVQMIATGIIAAIAAQLQLISPLAMPVGICITAIAAFWIAPTDRPVSRGG